MHHTSVKQTHHACGHHHHDSIKQAPCTIKIPIIRDEAIMYVSKGGGEEGQHMISSYRRVLLAPEWGHMTHWCLYM